MELQEFYDIIGGDFDEVLNHLRNEVVVKRFVLRFPEDKCFENLSNALQEKDLESAFKATVTMGDLSKNLSFTPLSEACDRLALALHIKKGDYETLFWGLKVCYHQIVRCIHFLEQEKQIFCDFSYEIRTSMNTIMGFANLLEQAPQDTENVINCSHKIKKSGEHLLSLVHMVLEKSKMDNGHLQLELTMRNLENYHASIMAGFSEIISQKKLVIEKCLQMKHTEVICDAMKLKDIGSALLASAIRFTPSGGRITLSVRELESRKEGEAVYQFVFSDTGLGFTQEQIAEFFNPQVENTDSAVKGMKEHQLGMSVVKNLVDFLGGTVDIKSEQGVGTTVVVSLPLGVVDKPKNEKIEQNTEQENCFEGKKVLLAEDNEWNAQLAEELLTSLGFSVEKTFDGAECVSRLQEAEADEFDLIIMDIRMPIIDGYEAARRIRRMGGLKGGIPIVAMTANAFSEDKMEAIEAGMNGHITKPIEVSKMIATLTGVLTKCRK